jgi:hypothetical protein
MTLTPPTIEQRRGARCLRARPYFFAAAARHHGVTAAQFHGGRNRVLLDFASLHREPDGSILDKQQVLKDLREQGLAFHSIDLEREQVRLFGSVAILTGESRTVSVRGGITSRAHFRLTAIYSQEDAGIQVVHFQSTSLPD